MIVTITHREIREGAKGDYLYIGYHTPKGKAGAKAVFGGLRDKWDKCQENATVDLILDEKYNVRDIKDLKGQLPPPQSPQHMLPEHREVVLLKDIEGYDHQQIAERLKVAPGTVMSRLHRARQELKKRLSRRKELFEAMWPGS